MEKYPSTTKGSFVFQSHNNNMYSKTYFLLFTSVKLMHIYVKTYCRISKLPHLIMHTKFLSDKMTVPYLFSLETNCYNLQVEKQNFQLATTING